MLFSRHIDKFSLFTIAWLLLATALHADTRAPTPPLEERVKGAELVFVGKLSEKKIEGDWAKAKLVVTESLHGVKVDQTVEVTWRIRVGDRPIYDVAEGTERIAILKDKHEGRYWLRDDKFESIDQLDKVKEILKNNQ